MEDIAILRPNLPKFLIAGQDPQFSNIIFKNNELDLLWVPIFIALEIYFIFGTKFFWNEGLILVLMSKLYYLVVILIFLVVTGRYMVVTLCYCSFPLLVWTRDFIFLFNFKEKMVLSIASIFWSIHSLPYLYYRKRPK